MSLGTSSGHQQYRELHASGTSLGSSVGGHGSFPLSASHFRSLPLSRRARGELLAEARQNARACLRLAFSDQWRYVPPEKDGAQVRKDTSNLAESRRMVRAAAVLRCQEHELRQVLANTSSDSWRAFARQCCGKRLLDSLVLHTVRSAPSSSSRADRSRHDACDDDDAGRASLWQSSSNNHELDSGRVPVRLVDDDVLSASGGSTPRRLPRRRSEAYNGRWTSGRRASNQDEAARDADPDGLGDGADELLTVKWGAFEAGAGRKRDLCVVDYQSLAFLPADDDGDDDRDDADAAEERERVHMWCLASTDGDRVGCPPLRASHGVKRAQLSRLGVFWRRSAEGETEVVVCGSFPSRHAPAATAALLAGLSKLQTIVEGLRVGSQRFLPRAAWVDDAARASCLLCLRHFFALRRKHHCRRCGEVVCADCSAVARVDRPGLGPAKLRMCKVCGLRARATPLRAADRENLFDRCEGGDALLLAVSFSGGDLRDRASCSGSKRSDAGDCSGSSLGSSDSSPSRPCGNQSGDERADSAAAAVHPMPADAEQQQQQPADKGGDMFELLCELACQTLSCPIASVALVDARGQVVRSAAGLDGRPGLDRELDVFLDRVMGQAPAVVLDAHADAQARRAFPLAPPAIRFFAGSPIHSRAGRKLGYVCVADTAGRAALGASCAFTMERLALLAVTTMERNAQAAAGNQAADDGDRPTARHTAAKCHGLASDVELVDAELLFGTKRGAEAAAPPPMEADGSVGDAQERMRRLLLKSYLTQQQLAAGTGPRGVSPF